MRDRVLSASLYGAATGLIYGICEYIAVVVFARLPWWPGTFTPDHWTWQFELLAGYVAAGAAIGGSSTFFRRVEPARGGTRSVVAVFLIVLVCGHALSRLTTGSNLVLDLALILMTVLVCRDLFVPAYGIWTSWMGSPWIVIPLAVCLIRIKSRFDKTTGFTEATLAISIGVCLAVLAASRSRLLCRALQNRFLPLSAAASLLFAMTSFWATKPLDTWPQIPASRQAGVSDRARPNVLLIVLDTVRADHMSVYGYHRRTTPNLEAFAQQDAVLFRNAVAASDLTLSSYGTFFTGLYPSWHRAHLIPGQGHGRLNDSFHTLAELLSEHGYSTMAVLANCGYLIPDSGMDQGFDFYDVRPVVTTSWRGDDYYLRDFCRKVLKRLVPTTELERPFRRGDQITDEGLHILSAMRQRQTPFFLTLNYMDAHVPYFPPPPYRDLFPGYNPAFNTWGIYTELQHQLALLQPPHVASAEFAHLISQYDGAIAFMDGEVKRLLDGLKSAGLYDNTLIIVTADHGEALGERSTLGHPASVYQELVHVPLVVKYPRSTPFQDRDVTATVSGADVFPTVLDVTGIRTDMKLQGESMRNVADNEARAILSESFPDGLSRLRRRSDTFEWAIYENQWKFIVSSTGRKELYDLKNDPAESQNVSEKQRDVAERLNRNFNRWAQLVPSKPALPAADKEDIRRLRSLGYVQ